MAADGWQLEAVHQQFDVFKSLTSMYRSLNRPILDKPTSKLVVYLKNIVQQHCLLNGERISSAAEIGSEIIKNMPKHERDIKCSFVVIIMNRNVNDKLMKVPVFVLMSNYQRIFIDVSCSVYNTWQEFMVNNDLPACKFCFPVDGFYNFGGKLKIDFGVSRVITAAFPRMSAPVSGGIMISTCKLATSFICAIPQTVFRCVKQLFSVAKQFLPQFCTGLPIIPYIQGAFDNLRCGATQLSDFLCNIYLFLSRFYLNLKQTTTVAWNTVFKKLNVICNFIRTKLGKYYELASSASRYMFLAVTSRIDSRIKGIELKAKRQLSSENATEHISEIALKTDVDSELDASTHEFDTVEKYFKDCKIESSFFHGGKNKYSDECFTDEHLDPTTLDLFDIGYKIADCLRCENLNEVQDIFESLSDTVADEYEKKTKNYLQALKAARAAAGGKIDKKAFNNAFGIKGKPEYYFWREIITNIHKDHNLISKIKKKIKEVEMKKDIFMMPIWKKCEDSEEGMYKIIGKRGDGTFSARKFITFLKKKGNISLDEKGMCINETASLICIRSDKFTIVTLQEIDEENTAEGMVYIRKHCD